MRLFIEILVVLLVTIVLPVVVAYLQERKEEKEYQKRELEKQRKIESRKEWEQAILNGKLSLYGDFEFEPTMGMYVTRYDLYLDEEEAKSLQVYCHRDNRWKSAIINGNSIPLLEVEEKHLGMRIMIDPTYDRTRVRFKRYDNIYKTYTLIRKY